MVVQRVSAFIALVVFASVLAVVPAAPPATAQITDSPVTVQAVDDVVQQVDPPAAAPKSVLLVVGNPAALSPLDSQVFDLLDPLYDVVTLDDNQLAQMVPGVDGMGGNTNDWPTIVVTKAEHQQMTNAWRAKIPYGQGTRTATRSQIQAAARDIYQDYPEILEALDLD